MIVTFQIATVLGIAVAYFVGAVAGRHRELASDPVSLGDPALIVLFLVLRLPDTPRWSLMNDRREEVLGKLGPLYEHIQRTDELIDQIVYRLYGLTEEEISVVEASAMGA